MLFPKVTTRELQRLLRDKKLSGLALDIDDTLSYTDRYYFSKMAEFHNPENLGLDAMVKKYKSVKRVPYWQVPAVQRRFKTFLGSSEFHAGVPLIPDANRIIRKIHTKMPIVVYITGRPLSTYPGTKWWLTRHKFPNAPVILCPPRFAHAKRHEWKASVLKFLYPEVRGIVDDHPMLKRELKAIRYKGEMFLYDNGKNSKRYHHRVARFRDWKEILKTIHTLDF